MEYLHRINKEKDKDSEAFDSSGNITSTEGYTEGSKAIDPESPDCFAKKVTITSESSNRYKYYIKSGNNGDLFNPWGMYSEGSQNKFAKHHGRPAWNFIQVSEGSFQHYMSFLSSRNPAWLNNAQREARNG